MDYSIVWGINQIKGFVEKPQTLRFYYTSFSWDDAFSHLEGVTLSLMKQKEFFSKDSRWMGFFQTRFKNVALVEVNGKAIFRVPTTDFWVIEDVLEVLPTLQVLSCVDFRESPLSYQRSRDHATPIEWSFVLHILQQTYAPRSRGSMGFLQLRWSV